MKLASPSRNVIIISLVIITALAITVFGFFYFIKIVEKPVWSGFKGEAKNKHYYLVTKLAEERGIDIELRKTYSKIAELPKIIPDVNTTILLSDTRRTLKQENVDNLIDWVVSGGHLILSQRDDTCEMTNMQTQTPILWYLNIDVCDPNSYDDLDEKLSYDLEKSKKKSEKSFETRVQNEIDKRFRKTKLKAYSDSANPVTLNISQKDIDVNIKINKEDDSNEDYIKNADTLFLQKSVNGNDLFASYQIGKGIVTVYTTKNYIFSDSPSYFGLIDSEDAVPEVTKDDNASFFLYLLGHKLVPQKVIWYERATYPSIATLLWMYGKYAIVMFFITLIIWVWRNWFRFGSLQTANELSSITLANHIDVTGKFYYKYKPSSLLIASYQSLHDVICSKVPHFYGLSQVEQVNLLHRITLLSKFRINDVLDLYTTLKANLESNNKLNQGDKIDQNKFTQIINDINEIRKKL